MLHHVYGRKFSRPMGQRQSLIKNLIRDFIDHGRLTTTKQKAKAIQGTIDHLVAAAKKGQVYASRQAIKVVGDKKTTHKLVGEIAPLFADRPSGFTRLTPLGLRSDTAEMVRLEWVVEVPTKVVREAPKKETPAKAKSAPKVTNRPLAPAVSKKIQKPTKQTRKFQTPASAIRPSNSK